MKKLCVIHSSLFGGGTEYHLRQLMKIENEMYKIFILTSDEKIDIEESDLNIDKLIRIPSRKIISFKGINYTYSLARQLYYLKEFIIYTMSYDVALIAWMTGSKRIFVGQRNIWELERFKYKTLVKIIKHIDCIRFIPNSKAAYRKLEGLSVNKNRIIYIPNGINIDEVNFKRRPRTDVKFVMLARFVKTKRYDVLLDACKHLVDYGYNYRFDLIGDGPTRYDIEELIDQYRLGAFVKIMSYNNMINIKDYDVGLLITETESFPQVLLEYGKNGLPVIVSNFEGVTDIVKNHESALIVPIVSISVANAMSLLADSANLRCQLAENFLRLMKCHYNLSITTKKLVDTFKKNG